MAGTELEHGEPMRIRLWLIATATAALGLATIHFILDGGKAAGFGAEAWAYRVGFEGVALLLVIGVGRFAVSLADWLVPELRGRKWWPLWIGMVVFAITVPGLLWAGHTLTRDPKLVEAWGAWWMRGSLVVPGLVVSLVCTVALRSRGPRSQTEVLAVEGGLLALASVIALAERRIGGDHSLMFDLAVTCLIGAPVLVVVARGWSRRLSRASTSSVAMQLLGPLAGAVLLASVIGTFVVERPVRPVAFVRTEASSKHVATKPASAENSMVEAVLSRLDLRAVEPPAAPGARLVDGADWNVVVIIVDALRHDALAPARSRSGSAHAKYDDTPFLNAWLQQSFAFTHAYAASSAAGKSMHALLHSSWADESARADSVVARMAASGRRTVAVVDHAVVVDPLLAAALADFDALFAYPTEQADASVSLAKQVLRPSDKPLFAMIQLSALNHPGFDGALLDAAAGTRAERYRRSLRWTDAAIEGIVEHLRRGRMAERTLIVVAGLTGESVGVTEYGSHGKNVSESEIRVPLAIGFPDRTGRRIDTTVGLVDVVPTLMEIVGADRSPSDRGHGLVRTMLSTPSKQTEQAYHFEDESREWIGVVRGRHKLMVRGQRELPKLVAVGNSAREHASRFSLTDATSVDLAAELLRHRPALGDELVGTSARTMLLEKLEASDAATSSAAVELLAKLTAEALRPAVIKRAEVKLRQSFRRQLERMFATTVHRDARVVLANELFVLSGRKGSKLLESYLSQLGRTPAQLEFVDALARAGQRSFAPASTAAMMYAWVERGPQANWDAWLTLLGQWREVPGQFKPALARMMERVASGEPTPAARRVALLRVLAHIDAKAIDQEFARDNRASLLMAMDDVHPGVAAAACTAFVPYAQASDHEALARRAREKRADIRVRIACAAAYARLEPARATSLLAELSEDPLLRPAALQQLGEWGDQTAADLVAQARKSANPTVQRQAKQAWAKLHATVRSPKR